MTKNIHESRKKLLGKELDQQYMRDIFSFLEKEKKEWKKIYPKEEDIFSVFTRTPFYDMKVVILWQDPYHGAGQAHWLAFSVQKWVKVPPSLKNMYKEIQEDVWWIVSNHGNLTNRSKQWVFLLNTMLTVEKSQPWSHRNIGRETFTDHVIETISQERSGVVFMLRWNFAKQKKVLIDEEKHLILEAPHPSPFSAYTWFYWCKHFSKANAYLKQQWKKPIIWL